MQYHLYPFLFLSVIQSLKVTLHKASSDSNNNIEIGPESRCYDINEYLKGYEAEKGKVAVKFFSSRNCRDQIYPFDNMSGSNNPVLVGSVKISKVSFFERVMKKEIKSFPELRKLQSMFRAARTLMDTDTNDETPQQDSSSKNISSIQALAILKKYTDAHPSQQSK